MGLRKIKHEQQLRKLWENEMTLDEQSYIDGYSAGERYCVRHKPTEQETYKIPCPVQWPEAMENGLYDAITHYRKGLSK